MPCDKSLALDLSVVIVTWNAVDFTRACLESLEQAADGLAMEIIVVDNASSDGTPEMVERGYPQVQLIRNLKNEGFARANNIGIRASHGQYIALLNSDVTVPSNCLRELHGFMRKSPTVGIAGPSMLGAGGERRRSCMRFPTLWSSFCRALALDTVLKTSPAFAGFLMGDFGHDRTMDVEVLNGWFWIVNRQALEQVGELDERFFIYGEDIDWCFRFRSAGWRVVFYPGAEAVHYGGASSSNAPVRFYLELQKANAQFWRKHRGRLANIGYLTTQWLHQGLRVAGYTGSYVLCKSSRSVAAHKVRRSVECLRWLAGAQSKRECEAR